MINKIRYIVICLGIFFIPTLSHAQEDLASSEAMLVEQQSINFQTFFFESLQQKAIGNYDKAIYALDVCHDIDKENIAVLFELSKNYTFLLKYTEAEYYVLKGLEFDASNIYMLRHLKGIKSKQNDFIGAITVQKKIILQKPNEEAELVILYIKSGEIENAVSLLKKLELNNNLPENLVPLKESLIQTKDIEDNQNIGIPEQSQSKLDRLKDNYKLKKDYNSLKLVLERELKTKQFLDLLKDSEEAVIFYPEQPYVYLMNGIALNNLRKYSEAIKRLESGLEFIVEDHMMEAKFMDQISLGYKGLGQNKTSGSYYKKALDLRNKEEKR